MYLVVRQHWLKELGCVHACVLWRVASCQTRDMPTQTEDLRSGGQQQARNGAHDFTALGRARLRHAIYAGACTTPRRNLRSPLTTCPCPSQATLDQRPKGCAWPATTYLPGPCTAQHSTCQLLSSSRAGVLLRCVHADQKHEGPMRSKLLLSLHRRRPVAVDWCGHVSRCRLCLRCFLRRALGRRCCHLRLHTGGAHARTHTTCNIGT